MPARHPSWQDRSPRIQEVALQAKEHRPAEAPTPANANKKATVCPADLATFVRNHRESRGWTQDTLADLARVNVRTIQRVEDGEPSSVHTRRAIASAFEFEDMDFLNKPQLIPDANETQRLMAECGRLQAEREQLEATVMRLNNQTRTIQMTLNMAAARDASWLHAVRTTLMPKQPSRVPFHNAAEIAMRGYHCSLRGRPTLTRVTWSLLPYNEGGLHRGYHAGLIFEGSDFAPGITCASRFKGAPANGAPDLSGHWRQPNIYFGERLETSANPDPEEGPIGYRGVEFAVRNPEGETSEWVEFTHGLEDEKLRMLIAGYVAEGQRLLDANEAAKAVDPLRRAYVYSRALYGWGAPEYCEAEAKWNVGLDRSMLDKLRFRETAGLRVVAGPHAGKIGTVEKLMLRHVHAYLLTAADGDQFQASDEQVELAA